ncbi:glycosyl hydrolase 2 galactose-binding domain-containing protein [Vibrio rumoiensis]|uniref:Beta-galactosidase n=1 Tax=Vibrio rumoiensis 1S-45 TaxID=1188252 RepID=A0A1E5E503_9VIBR|nr:sugar-binding domain-containing protein [Vibrio rumoiensis]OEF28427.1 beta-galactosidase [Vibrio rumoiensis 1S-45]
MHFPLDGLWQISPLTDLSIPQNDIAFPAKISSVLPDHLSEQYIAEQEWHLMHDIEVDDAMLELAAIDLVIEGINHYAEVRVGGGAVFDCDGSQYRYQKDIKEYLNLGKNRIEILLLEPDEDFLIEDESTICHLGKPSKTKEATSIGIARTPFLRLVRNVRLHHVVTEQIWHHGGGCELKVDVYYATLKPGLVSTQIKYEGMMYTVPLDIRSDYVSAIFQMEAPKQAVMKQGTTEALEGTTQLYVHLDGYHFYFDVALSDCQSVSHYPL